MVIAQATRMVPSLIEGAPETLIALWSTIALAALETNLAHSPHVSCGLAGEELNLSNSSPLCPMSRPQ